MINPKQIKDYLKVEYLKDSRMINAIVSGHPVNGYIGWTGYGNLGDEVVYEAYEKLFPGSNFTEFRISRPVKWVSALLRREIPFGYVALGGGTIINQSKFYLAQTEYLINKNVPMFCMGTGVAAREFWKNHEDVHTANDIEKWVPLLKQFIYVGVRGPLSQKRLADVGLNVEIVGDTALAFTNETYQKRAGRKIIGLNISPGTGNMMWGDQEVFKKEILSSVQKFIADGFEIRLLPIWKDDLALCKYIDTQVNDSACTTIVAYDTIPHYIEELDKCDLFVGLKLHATILATMLRIPSIMLEYRPKCLDYMQSVNMGDYSIRTDQLTRTVLDKKLHELIKNYDAIVTTLDERLLHYKYLQQGKAKYIIQQLNKK